MCIEGRSEVSTPKLGIKVLQLLPTVVGKLCILPHGVRIIAYLRLLRTYHAVSQNEQAAS